MKIEQVRGFTIDNLPRFFDPKTVTEKFLNAKVLKKQKEIPFLKSLTALMKSDAFFETLMISFWLVFSVVFRQ